MFSTMEVQNTQFNQALQKQRFINQSPENFGPLKQIVINIIPNFFMVLTNKLICKLGKSEIIEGILLHENGQPVIIPSDLSQVFFAKYRNQYMKMGTRPFGNFTYGYADNTVHYKAKIHVSSFQAVSFYNFDFILESLKAAGKAIQKALQAIQIIHKTSRNSLKIKRLQKRTRRQINRVLSQSQGQNRYDLLQDYPQKLKQALKQQIAKRSTAILQVEVIKLVTKQGLEVTAPSQDIQNPAHQEDQFSYQSNEKRSTTFDYQNVEHQQLKMRALQLVNQQIVHYGGFCEVTKVQCDVKIQGSNQFQKLSCPVAKKVLKSNRREDLQRYQQKFTHQMKIIRSILFPSCLATYIKPKKEDPSIVYMQYLDRTLKEQIYRNISIAEKLDLCIQLIDIVICLHKSGVVHRDLKPTNIMVSEKHARKIDSNIINLYTQTKNGTSLKVIDFLESALCEQSIQKAIQWGLGCTLPYSPLQCSVQCYQGYNYFSIDYWSVGVIIFQIFFKKIPISYSKCFGPDILKGWTQQFCLPMNVARKHGYRFIQNIICIVCKSMMNITPALRMNLFRARLLIKIAQVYLHSLDKL